MCATFQIRGKTYKPGREINGSGKGGIVRNIWSGFARKEILAWWQKKGAVLVDVQTTQPLIKIVTRASIEEELQR